MNIGEKEINQNQGGLHYEKMQIEEEKENPATGIAELKQQIGINFAKMVLNQVKGLQRISITSVDGRTLEEVRKNVLAVRKQF